MTRNCTRQKGLLISVFLTMMNECPGGSDDLIVFICCRWRPHRTSVSTACDGFATIKPMPTSRPLILITSHSGHGIRLKMPPVHLHLFAPSFYPQLEHNRIILILASLPRMPFYHLYLLQWYYPSRTHSNVAYWRSQLRSHPDPHLLSVYHHSIYSSSRQRLIPVTWKYSFLCTSFICPRLKDSLKQDPNLSHYCIPIEASKVSAIDK